MPGLKGKDVHIDDRYLHVELEDGRVISTPVSWYPELERASISEFRKYRFICDGTGIEWETLDYHLSIEAMLYRDAKQGAA
ncbi:uncharacterized protein DUF2442 [Marinobacter pelagius]|uniref:Uncharacterized protein DUF2442 n=1 Tax=Marinobacter pelagius TaxID=379482 RepID=A0A366GQL8_9GAMM|nr:DUF2442 domain-containing protein [Marinobacter pelagius]RBP29966.1 uncharacterized protein DUF2442 [Marinobacter pelagius]